MSYVLLGAILMSPKTALLCHLSFPFPLPTTAAASRLAVEEQVLLDGFLFPADTAAAVIVLSVFVRGQDRPGTELFPDQVVRVLVQSFLDGLPQFLRWEGVIHFIQDAKRRAPHAAAAFRFPSVERMNLYGLLPAADTAAAVIVPSVFIRSQDRPEAEGLPDRVRL